MNPEYFSLVIALTIVYFLARLAHEYLIRKKLILDAFVKDILIAIFFSIILYYLINPDIILKRLNLDPSLFDTNSALEKLSIYFNQSKQYLDFIVSASLFIAISDLIISITALVSLSALNILATYQFYVHQILGVLESLASLIGLIIIIIQALLYLLKISLNLKSFLEVSLLSLIPPRLRYLGKAILILYILLYFVLPFIVNYSIEYSSLSKLSYSYPSNFTAIKVSVRDYTNSPVLMPILLHLRGENFSKHYVLKVYDSKQIYLFTREYEATSVYIYWHNLTNSACCYDRKNYSYCYNCFISPATLNLKNNAPKVLLISLPFTVLPCNNDIGISGLVYAYVPNGGSVAGEKLYDKIVFHVTPQRPKLVIMVAGGDYSLEYKNNTKWTLYIRVKNIRWFPKYDHYFMEKLLHSEVAWWNRTGLDHYKKMIHSSDLPNNPRPENIREYMLIVYLKSRESGNYTENPTFNVTISGRGCWKTGIIYFNDWKEVNNIFGIINLVKDWALSTYRIIVNIVNFMIIFTASIYILLNYEHSSNTISKFFIYVLRSFIMHIYPIFKINIYKHGSDKEDINNKRQYYHQIKSLKKKKIIYILDNYYKIDRIKNNISKARRLYKPISTQIKKTRKKIEFYAVIKNPYKYSKAYCYYIYKMIFHDSELYKLVEKSDKEKIFFNTDRHLLMYIDYFELSRLMLQYIGAKRFPEREPYFLKALTEFREKLKDDIKNLMRNPEEYNTLINNLNLKSAPSSPEALIHILEKEKYLPDLDYIYLDILKKYKKSSPNKGYDTGFKAFS